MIDPIDRAVFSSFYDLYREKPKAKFRNCLRCKKEFKSHDNSRVCASCAKYISNLSKLQGEVYEQ